MANSAIRKPVLPKSLLDMKFMKKTKERLDKETQDSLGHKTLYSNIITDEMRHASGNFITEHSFLFCEEFIEGRLSFKGMNPELERLMELEQGVKEDGVKGEMDKDVSDEILAKKMAAFNNKKRKYDSPGKSFIKKKRREL